MAEQECKPGERKQEDKMKLLQWVDNVKIETPELASGAGQMVLVDLKLKFEAYRRWAKDQIRYGL